MSFVIPIYNNMPELPCTSPAISSNDFLSDNTKVYANVENTLNVRTGPSTSYEILTSIKSGTQMTRIAKGKQNGELWDRVKLSNGIVGYVFQTYVKEVPDIEVERIELSLDKTTINKGEKIKLKTDIYPSDALDKTLKFSSNNTKVANVSSDGYIVGLSSGTAQITAKASNGITSSIDINVYSPVTDIILAAENCTIQVDSIFKIIATVLPEDANNKDISYKSENENIASVDENGNIKGISEGETNIIVSGEEDKVTKKIKVTVVKKLAEGEIIFDESLKVDGNEITGLENSNNTVDKILNKIQTNYTIEFYDAKGNKIEKNELVGTGSVIKIIDNGEIIIEYNVIMYGDIDGNGKINSVDLLVLQRHILEIEKLKGVFIKAGNIRKDGKNPTSVDCLLIQRHILGIQTIKQ